MVDKTNGWYLWSLLGVSSAERLAWAGQNFLLSNSPPLSALRTFETVILDGCPHTVAEIQKQWGIVELQWKELLSSTYTAPGYLPYTDADYLIAREGWQDFFNKFGINPDRVEYVYELQSIFQSFSMPYTIIHSPWR